MLACLASDADLWISMLFDDVVRESESDDAINEKIAICSGSIQPC